MSSSSSTSASSSSSSSSDNGSDGSKSRRLHPRDGPLPNRAEAKADYVPLPLLGQIREKGFSAEPETRCSFVSAPQPSVIPFPVARHRSEGPHWASLPQHLAHSLSGNAENLDDVMGKNAAFVAQPLVRKKKGTIDLSKFKAGRNKNPEVDIVTAPGNRVLPGAQVRDSTPEVAKKMEIVEELRLEDSTQMYSIQSADEEMLSVVAVNERMHSVKSMEDTDMLSEMNLENMTVEQIIEAQQELTERFRPDILDMLRRRGKAKVEDQKKDPELTIRKGLMPMSDKTMANKKEERDGEITRMSRVASIEDGARLTNSVDQGRHSSAAQLLPESGHLDWRKMSWVDRVEAVRSFKFGLDGAFLGCGSSTVSPSLVQGDDKPVLLNATERDILRTEGNPSSDGYTIKDAVALVRSMVPAQRSAGLRIISHILENASFAFQPVPVERGIEVSATSVDWQAIWAYALGPEPELVLTLRLALDDSHATPIVICARALEHILSSSANEQYFQLLESLWPGDAYLFTAPIFQKPSFQESGLIGDCYWKYNVKPSDMLNSTSGGNFHKKEDESSVKKDSSVANQDVAAGLIRMGILPRIRYIMEVERLLAAEDSLFSILIALARHSPTAADAVMKCPRLMDTILQLFIQDGTFTWPSRPKAIKLLKVLSIANEANCIQIFNSGLFHAAQLGLSREGLTLGPVQRTHNAHQGSWIGLVEALNFWRVCIKYSLGVLCFSDFYPALLYWVSAPNVILSMEGAVDFEHGALTVASFQLLEALANTLPILHVASESEPVQEADMNGWDFSTDKQAVWSWKFAIPIVENSLGWLSGDLIQACIERLEQQNGGTAMLFRMLSSILHFLSTVCGRILEDGRSRPAWLPTFFPKLVLQLVKSNLLDFSANECSALSSNPLVQCLVSRKDQISCEVQLQVTNCLHGLVRLLRVVEHLFKSAKMGLTNPVPDVTSEVESVCIEETLGDGLAVSAKRELMQLLRCVGDGLIKQTGFLSMLHTSRRGGPAPGVGTGWGCQGGGYWSVCVLMLQADSILMLELIEFFPAHEVSSTIPGELPSSQDIEMFSMDSFWRIRVGLSALLLMGPHQRNHIERTCSSLIFHKSALDLFRSKTKEVIGKWVTKLEVGVVKEMEIYLETLSLHIEEMRDILCQHVQDVWFQKKRKVSGNDNIAESKNLKGTSVLPTVYEDSMSTLGHDDKLSVEWATQKLPLPSFWFLSPLLSNFCTQTESQDLAENGKIKNENLKAVKVVSHGLLLLFGLEALMDGPLYVDLDVSMARRIHALANVFTLSDDIFLEKPVRDMIGALQELYMECFSSGSNQSVGIGEIDSSDIARGVSSISRCSLDFETLVDQRYTSFIDRLTRQFAAVSYGDLVFSRQIAIYLTRNVPDGLRLRVWKSLETEHMLEFLPPIEKCAGQATVYLYPVEENQEIIKCYASAWAIGALDRAKNRNSVSFSLAQFHVGSFIFKVKDNQNQVSRQTVAKDLLVALARRPRFQEFLQALFNYDAYGVIPVHAEEKDLRYAFLEEVCRDSPNLLAQIRPLKRL